MAEAGSTIACTFTSESGAYLHVHNSRLLYTLSKWLKLSAMPSLSLSLIPSVPSLFMETSVSPPPRGPCSKARELDSRTVVQPCIWFKEEPSQFSMGQTAQSLTCYPMEKPYTGLDECPRILLSCFRARTTACPPPQLFYFLSYFDLLHTHAWSGESALIVKN